MMSVIAPSRLTPEAALAKREAAALPPMAGALRTLLRLEALTAFGCASLLYIHLGGGWRVYAVLFFTPDLAMAFYLLGPRVGAVAYNTMHTYAGPGALLIAALLAGRPTLALVGLVWAAHIGFDRALGYGLKYATGFHYTHLGRIGRSAPRHA